MNFHDNHEHLEASTLILIFPKRLAFAFGPLATQS